ncbi:RNA recognition motif domain-containing protein [Ditylenchus destructor]|nr:RNA recognition motif domain-containing protein [Ditylenchus destructor]
MIARSRLVGNFLSHCAVHRQLTRVIGLSQSVRLQSTNGNPDKNFTLKLPPNATGVSVEHSNEKSLDGTSLRVTLNISVLQSDTRASEFEQSRKQLENLTRSLAENANKNLTEKTNQTIVSAPATYDLLQSYNSKSMREKNGNQELKVTKSSGGIRTILIDGLSAEISKDAVRDYFSRFGEIDHCHRFLTEWFITFKSPNAVNHVLNCAPHYVVGNKIVNEIPRDIKLVPSKNRDLETKDQSQLLEVLRHENNQKMIIVRGISKETSQDDLRAYFSRFGNVDTCFICRIRDCATGYVGFNSPKTVNHVLDCGPHYNYYNTNDLASEDKLDKDRKEFLAPSKDELTVTLGSLPSITNSDSLKKLFSKYGQVTHINAECKYENGVEKESIYVTFATKEQVVNVLKHQPLFLDGQMLIRSFCDNSILVKNLPKNATGEKLQKIFSEFGELTDWGVKADGSYGWVSFARPVNVRTLEDKSPTMFGKKLDVEPVKNTQEAEGKNESRMDPKEFEEFQRTFEDDYDRTSKW